MDIEDIKRTRVKGAKLWNALSLQEKAVWKDKAAAAARMSTAVARQGAHRFQTACELCFRAVVVTRHNRAAQA